MVVSANATEAKEVSAIETKFLVRVVYGRNVNVHIHNKQTKQILHIYFAGEYKLTSKLIQYVKEHGVKKTLKSYYAMGQKVYSNDMYQMTLSAEQIKSLLVITPRNKNSDTLRKLLKFIGEGGQ